ncbi:MAG TPA: Hpt domain-containing protein [Xanthomonadales bacterium]|nr:Hpt domain-containing protein [Xanthomonadales bacterium]
MLDRVADTLGMLGLGVPRRVVQEQRTILQDVANGARPADEGALLDIAGALLYVEASLDENIRNLGSGADSQADGEAASLELPQTEVRKILEALIKEAQSNLAQAKQEVVAFVESNWDHGKVVHIPQLLEEISGAMRMLNLPDPAELTHALARFVEVELLRQKRVPTSDQMDRLADTLASIDYYLESTLDQRAGRDKILAVTRESLESLGYWPLPPETELEELAGVALEQAPVAAPQAAAPTAPAAPAAPEPPRFDIDVDTQGLTFETDTASPSHAFRGELEPEVPADIAAVDLPHEDIAAHLERIGRGESAPVEARGDTLGEEPPRELSSVVEIAPGDDLSGLLVGEREREALSPPPPPADLAGLKFAETHAGRMPEPDDEFDWVEIEEEVEIDAPAEASADASFQSVPSDDIDDEIREVFVEEVQDEIDNIGRQLPLWQRDVSDFEQLKPIRRSFHTLKGSGRLVGALALGEFAWKVENMLNRVLDKTIPPGEAVQALLGKAVAALPEMLSALRGEGPPRVDVAQIMGVAERIAAGEEAYVRAAERIKVRQTRRVQVPKTRTPAIEPVELTRTLDITKPIEEPASEAAELPSIPLMEASELAAFEAEDAAWATEAAPAYAGATMPAVDPMLLEILRSEVEGHLATVGEYLAATRPAPVPEAVLRAVHTMHGAISMADVPVISGIVGPLETYLKRLRGSGEAPSAYGYSVVERSTALIGQIIAKLDQPGAALPDSGSLPHDLAALRDELPEPESSLSVFNLAIEDDEEAVAASAPAGDAFAPIDEPLVPLEDDATRATEIADETVVDLSTPVEAPIPLDEVEAAPFAGAEALESDTAFAPEEPLEAGTAFLLDEPIELGAEGLDATDAELAGIDVPALEPESALALGDELVRPEEPAEPAPDVLDEFVEPVAPEAEAEEFAELASAVPLSAEPAHVPADFSAEPDFSDLPVAEAGQLEAEVEAALAAAADATPARREEEALEPAASDDAAELAEAHVAPVAQPVEDPDPEGPLVLADMDEDLLEIFVEEGNDILDKADTLVARLRESATDSNAIAGLQRHLHTLKGNARAVGLVPIGDLTHAIESLIEAVAGDRMTLDRTGVEALERGFDRLHRMVARVAKRQAIAMPTRMIARFDAIVAGEQVEAAETPTFEPAPARTEPEAEAAEAEAAPVTAAPAKPRAKPAPVPEPIEEEVPTRAPQEMIRVRSDLLDALVNFAGEVSIYRSRLEQQMGTYRFNLVELDQTVMRLRDQLRKLEIETEAQIIARYQREAEVSHGEFDPLELDRFSTLQQYSRALAESVSDLHSLQTALDDLTRQSETLLLQQSRVASELQEGLMRTRMVPFDSVVPFLRRIVRQTADELGKRASLRIEGAQGEMDRNLLERMKAPFEHMLRNALAHGVESPEQRRAAGKPEEGTVRINVSREATEVVIRVSDDGRGMDRDRIREKAIERGLMRPDAHLSDRDLFGFVLETGFSTAETITKIAGRGVGMDVVASEIKQLGGSLAIDSQRGHGSQFTVRLPFTLAVTQAILVRLGEAVYAVPMSSVQGVARIQKDDFERRLMSQNPVFGYAGEEYVLHELNMLLGVPHHRAGDESQLPMLLIRSGDLRAAVHVDTVLGSREIVVKSVGPQVSSVPGIFGATIMGDGSVIMILDLAPLVRRAAALRAEVAAEYDAEAEAVVPVAPAIPVEPRRQPLVMVVDDSITMRKVTSRVLERHDMEVATAKDGLDAVEKLQDRIPDLMLLDIEMPRMDGYELATYMRNDSRLKHVPIIMITSRTGEKHRQRAFEIGVDRYLGKPYQEADLLRNVDEILKVARAVE